MKITGIPYLAILFMAATGLSLTTENVNAQRKIAVQSLPSLPDKQGWAGMFAGTTGGTLICMGGANFPGKYPWEGGRKMFYDQIYVLNGTQWRAAGEKMDKPLAYGVSVTYNDTVITAGGCNGKEYSKKVTGYYLRKGKISSFGFPDLPVPLGYMTGGLVGDILVIAGGNSDDAGEPLNKVFALDLATAKPCWLEIPSFPGPGRILPAGAVFDGQFYLFSGNRIDSSAGKQAYSHALTDAYRLTVTRKDNLISAIWEVLAQMPKAVAGIGNPVPVFQNGKMIFWGGVDAVTNLHQDPSTFPGIAPDVLIYDGKTDLWVQGGIINNTPARVTLPVVYWGGQWIYLGGEIKSGIRTNTVIGLKLK